MYLFFRLTIIKNIMNVSKSIEILSSGEGDLTMQLKVGSNDEIGTLTDGVNRLVSKLREIISDLYGQAGHVAISSCRTMAGIERLAAAIFEQKELAASVAVASEEMSATLNDVANTTAKASALSQQVDESAADGRNIVEETAESNRRDKSRCGGDAQCNGAAGELIKTDRRDYRPDRRCSRPDQSSCVERCDRSGKGGGCGARLCCGRGRG